MQKNIYLYLCGGLGNQLFQYAAARNIAMIKNAKLILDTGSGFVTDFIWFNTFNLNIRRNKNIIFSKVVIIFWVYRFFKIFFKKKLFYSFFNSKLIDETCINYFEKKIIDINFNKNLYMMGFYQVDKYFLKNEKVILEELKPKKPTKKTFLNIKKKLEKKNSIVMGFRLYQDVNRNKIMNFGGLTNANFYEKAINIFKKKISNPEFYIFSSKSSDVQNFIKDINSLNKYPVHMITDDLGFNGAMNNLWLMSFCRNHIVPNSSFYWWGAYLSKINYANPMIICSNNFINKDSVSKKWILTN
jgi:hypothetical protein